MLSTENTLPNHFEALSMKDLRTELDAIGADYSKCIEKSEFVTMLAKRLDSGTESNMLKEVRNPSHLDGMDE